MIRRENRRETGRDVGERRRFQNGTEVDPFQFGPLDARRSEEGFHVGDALDLHVLAAMERETKRKLVTERDFGLTVLLDSRKQLNVLFDFLGVWL